jgi:hypothetical protein
MEGRKLSAISNWLEAGIICEQYRTLVSRWERKDYDQIPSAIGKS